MSQTHISGSTSQSKPFTTWREQLEASKAERKDALSPIQTELFAVLGKAYRITELDELRGLMNYCKGVPVNDALVLINEHNPDRRATMR